MECSLKKCELYFLLFLAAGAACLLRIALTYPEISRLAPLLVCSMTLVMVAVRLCQIFVEERQDGKISVSKKTLLFTLLLFVCYLGGTFLVGFLISTTLFISAVMWLSGYQKPLTIAAITLGYVVLMYFVFVRLFNVVLPTSFIGF